MTGVPSGRCRAKLSMTSLDDADAAVADLRPERLRVVRAVDADLPVAGAERGDDVRVRGEPEGVGAVEPVGSRRLDEVGEVVAPARGRGHGSARRRCGGRTIFRLPAPGGHGARREVDAQPPVGLRRPEPRGRGSSPSRGWAGSAAGPSASPVRAASPPAARAAASCPSSVRAFSVVRLALGDAFAKTLDAPGGGCGPRTRSGGRAARGRARREVTSGRPCARAGAPPTRSPRAGARRRPPNTAALTTQPTGTNASTRATPRRAQRRRRPNAGARRRRRAARRPRTAHRLVGRAPARDPRPRPIDPRRAAASRGDSPSSEIRRASSRRPGRIHAGSSRRRSGSRSSATPTTTRTRW